MASDRSRSPQPTLEGSHSSHGPEDTEALGSELAAHLSPGEVVLIEGDLGAGKTTFVRGACRALGVDRAVRSPTFTIGHRYPARIPVAHVDLFRVRDLRDEDPDLLAEYLRPDTIAFVECPRQEDDLAGLGRVRAHVRIDHAGGDERLLEIELE
jgi:tRNA threonylcarbamoyladenosine biosynthesis protein TsaE